MELGKIDYKSLGIRVRNVRVRQGFTQEEVANKANLSLSHVSNVETANTKVSLPTLKLLADILDTTVDEFLADSQVNEKIIHQNDIAAELEDCTPSEARYLATMVKNEKANLRNTFATNKNTE